MTLDKHNICVCNIVTFLLFRREFTFPSAWNLLISLLVWKGFYICQKYIFFYIKNKQASPAQIEKVMQT